MTEQLDAYAKAGQFPLPKSKRWTFQKSKDAALSYLRRKVPVVLYGPPGTGKTLMAHELTEEIRKTKQVVSKTVQFHPKFTYEDFIEGYKPDGKGGFVPAPGVFKQFCADALSDPQRDYVFVIDEFNRADLSTTLGEVLFLIEDRDTRVATTAHTASPLRIPANLAIIGTMNTADKTIAIVDFALRRRFKFIPVWPDYIRMREWLSKVGFSVPNLSVDDYCRAAFVLNHRIASHPLLSKHMQLGQSLFVPDMNHATIQGVADNFRYTILPQLESYFGFGREDELVRLLGSSVAEKFKQGDEITDEDIAAMLRNMAADAIGKAAFE